MGIVRKQRNQFDRGEGEDDLDYLHRLAKHRMSSDMIAERVQIPVENVRYVLARNGYPQR